MRNRRIKTLFIYVAACAVLLPYFAFLAVLSANAQGSSVPTAGIQIPTVQPPTMTGREGAVDQVAANAEAQRLVREFQTARANEGIAGARLDPIETSVKGCDITTWLNPSSAPLCGIYAAVRGVARILGWTILPLASAFFEKLVDINLDNGETALFASAFVSIGWGISRDIANMFFIFFILWMALATIFQFESYSAKRLLPKLIIVALLVNFSLPIGTFLIRTTNAVAHVFHQAAKGNSSLTAQIMNVAAIHKAYSSQTPDEKASAIIKANPELDAVCNPGVTKRITDSILNSLLGTNFGNANKKASPGQIAHAKYVLQLTDETTANLTTQAAICSIYNSKRGNTDGELIMIALMASIWQIVISLIASFVFLAGGIFLLVRSISLATLLVFGPLAFLFMILPATQEHWNKWWTKLTQWSFFAPVFMFMLMLSLRSASSLFNVYVAQQVGPLTMSDSVGLGVQFLMVSGLLVASLFVAQSMGIAMSGTVIGWGRSMARGAGRYAKGKGIQYAKIGAGGVAGGIQSNALLQKTLSSIPLLGGSIARGLGATRAAGEAAEKQRQRQKFGFAEKLSDEGRANYIASERAGAARDMLTKMDDGDRRRTVNALSTQGQIELAQKLRSVQSEALVGNATNNPEVYARLSGEAGPLDSKDYPAKVAKIAHDKFKAENLAPDFLRGATGREYLKTATEDELKAIAKTRQGAEALGGTLAEVARTIHEEVTDARTDMQQRAVPYDLKQLTQTISNQHLSPQTQQYLNTAPGMYEGRMAMKTRGGGGGGGGNDREDEEDNFMRMLQKAAKRGVFKSEE